MYIQPLNLFRNNVILSDRMTDFQVELAFVGHKIACIFNLISNTCIFIYISCNIKGSHFNQGHKVNRDFKDFVGRMGK